MTAQLYCEANGGGRGLGLGSNWSYGFSEQFSGTYQLGLLWWKFEFWRGIQILRRSRKFNRPSNFFGWTDSDDSNGHSHSFLMGFQKIYHNWQTGHVFMVNRIPPKLGHFSHRHFLTNYGLRCAIDVDQILSWYHIMLGDICTSMLRFHIWPTSNFFMSTAPICTEILKMVILYFVSYIRLWSSYQKSLSCKVAKLHDHQNDMHENQKALR